MIDQPDIFLRNLKFAYFSILTIAILSLLSAFMLSADFETAKAQDNPDTSTKTRAIYDGPNAITAGLSNLIYDTEQAMDTAGNTIASASRTAAAATTQSGKKIARTMQKGLMTAGRGIGSSALTVGRTARTSASFVANAHLRTWGMVWSALDVNTFIRPTEHAEVPIIDPDSPELLAALDALPAKEEASNSAQANSGPVWPMHGYVTADFGIDHRPYQQTHTGIDISNGQGSGVTPVKPFRPGQVSDTAYSRQGLGNHVIIDHGNGVTSVYAHLASIDVQKGQNVDLGTVLGRVGSTGLSTGPHLHFEIRVHGQAANPRQFISGNP